MRKTLNYLVIIALFGGLTACDGTEPLFSSDKRDAVDPFGKKTLANEDDETISQTFAAVREKINEARALGIEQAVAQLKTAFADKVDPQVFDRISDRMIGDDMPGKTWTRSSTSSTEAGLGHSSFGLKVQDYYTCPLEAPEENEGTSCDELVDTQIALVQTEIENAAQDWENAVETEYAELSDVAKQYIASWALTAQMYGSDIAAIYAKYELKAEQHCDDKSNAMTVAYSLGREQGWEMVLERRAWAMSQLNSCTVNTDAIAEQVRVMTKANVDSFMEEQILCPDSDWSTTNSVLIEVDKKRKEGIMVGIDERVEILRTELFNERANIPCGDGGDGGDGGGGGDPVVIDLDGDGLTLANKRVDFDMLDHGSSQSVRWIGPTEGLVVMDHNRDGVINSSAELMGDKSDCNGHMCYDGINNLQVFDSPGRGGNADGVLDRDDLAFARLQIWVDRNIDGVSQPEELSSLSQHGIISISLSAERTMVNTEAGRITATFSVMTNDGVRQGYDMWLRTRIKPHHLTAYLPRHSR